MQTKDAVTDSIHARMSSHENSKRSAVAATNAVRLMDS